jgi:hypothetical protein
MREARRGIDVLSAISGSLLRKCTGGLEIKLKAVIKWKNRDPFELCWSPFMSLK